jgi:hypothetical protein
VSSGRATTCSFQITFEILTGAIKNEIVTITVSTRCKGHDARFGLTEGELGGGEIEGAYSTFVDGHIHDRGSFLLER